MYASIRPWKQYTSVHMYVYIGDVRPVKSTEKFESRREFLKVG